MITEWFHEKFLTPLCHYYTVENTIAYGLILCLAALLTYKGLQKFKTKIDMNFFLSLLPFIIYGGWTRALRDHNLGIYGSSRLFCSPPIYFFIFFVTIFSLLIGILIQENSRRIFCLFKTYFPAFKVYKHQKKFEYEYWKTTAFLGFMLLAYNFSITEINNWNGFLIVLGLFAFWTAVFFGISKFFPKILSRINAGILAGHLLDASATFTALTLYGYYEQHVLPSFLIGILGPWIMFPLKIAVVWTILYLIDKNTTKKDKYFVNFLKIIILILGLALGIRDWLTISILVA